MKRYTHPQVEPDSHARESGQTVIDIRALTKSFVDNEVLRGVDLKLYRGENLVILGRSGAGKTVLIKCIVGLMKPDGGELIVLGKDILKLDYKEMDKVRAKIGFQFQGGALYDSMTVRKNLEFPLRRLKRKMANEEVDELVHEVLESVGLLHTIDQMPAELSGGMKKRIAMARTLILKPEIIIYDEPTAGLDPITAKEISRLILKMQEQYHTSALVITHDMICAQITGNRMVILLDGVNYASGTFAELKASDDPKIKAFFY